MIISPYVVCAMKDAGRLGGVVEALARRTQVPETRAEDNIVGGVGNILVVRCVHASMLGGVVAALARWTGVPEMRAEGNSYNYERRSSGGQRPGS